MDETALAIIKKLGSSADVYRLKLRGDEGDTHWLNITPAQMRAIVEIYLER